MNPSLSKKIKMITGFNLIFCVFVILWGAFVRATGSGAGCGDHWPLCNGDVVPRGPEMETIIELTHRLTSGLFLIGVVYALIVTIRATSTGHHLRRVAWLSLGFVLVEAAIGAGLVLLELVAEDASAARVYWVGGHLLNTFFLVAVLTLNWWAVGQDRLPSKVFNGFDGKLLWAGLVLMLLVASSGAIVALGDTLFPAASFAEGHAQTFDPSSHFLVRLRLYHPIIAVVCSAVILWLGMRLALRSDQLSKLASLGKFLAYGVAIQLAVGFLNMLLLAPVWIQMVHLLIANVVWIALVVTGLERSKVTYALK